MKKNIRNQWTWGFTCSTENWNGRFAMVAFILIFFLELYTNRCTIWYLGIS